MIPEIADQPQKSPTASSPISTLNFLNCYQIVDPSILVWPVSIYSLRRKNIELQTHEDRGAIKNIVWGLRKQYSNRCPGYGFVIDLDEETVAVPAAWNLPSPISVEGYEVTFDRTFTTSSSEPAHSPLIVRILQEGVKNHFKENRARTLGNLWQDYNQFCEMPNVGKGEFIFCRRFGVSARILRNNKWVLKFLISTATLDGMTLNDYYSSGKVDQLAAMIESKRANRTNRSGRPIIIRVWRNESTQYQIKANVLQLDDPGVIVEHGVLSRQEQRSLGTGTVRCCMFNRAAIEVPMNEIRLILDTQITKEDHGDTIIEPDERKRLLENLRKFVCGATIFGQTLNLSQIPVHADEFPTRLIPPPAIRVRNQTGGEKILDAVVKVTGTTLADRCKIRSDHVRRFGFLQQRPINPLLACPKWIGENRAKRLKSDLEYIWHLQGVDFKFGLLPYSDVEDIRKAVEDSTYDALIAVLPEGSQVPYGLDDTHEKIKRRIELPSQCIQHDRILPEEWLDKRPREFKQAQPKLARRIHQYYEGCLLNLLVKHHWVPFAPAEPFHYNVHIGLDVGGRSNNRAMACLGYGFQRPLDGLLFLPAEIPIDVQKAEPIPTKSLFTGLLELFEYIQKEITSVGSQANFDRTIFYRDGQLLGAGDDWNERDALYQLHAELLRREWITPESIWTGVEILKEAEGWRLLRNDTTVTNPLVGECTFLYDDDSVALLSTTGAPYLTQGTACPLMIRIVNIHGSANADEVLRDLVWQADMCFTKPDMGMRLPWVLHVADTGALQLSRSYSITGITV